MNPNPYVVYTGRTTNWPMVLLTTALVPLFVVMAVRSGSWTAAGVLVPLAVVFAAAAVNLLTASSVRATAGPTGVTVSFGAFGLPRFRYPAERIERAEAVTVSTSQLAWGISWTPRKGLMLTLRSGPALRLRLTSGRTVTISTPNPQAAVDAIRTGPARPT